MRHGLKLVLHVMTETAAGGPIVLTCCFGNCTGKEGGKDETSVHVCVCMCTPSIERTADWQCNQIQNPSSLAWVL